MRLRLKLTILLGLAFLLSFAGLFVYDTMTQGAEGVMKTEARPRANMSVSSIALSIRGQEIFTLLTDLETAVEEDDVPKSLQILGALDVKKRERLSLLRAVHPKPGENPMLASQQLRREQIVEREDALIGLLVNDLSAARGRDARMQVMRSFMQGEYALLEKERRAKAEVIAGLALEESTRAFSKIESALERGHNLYLAIILTLLLSFVFVIFFINKKIIQPIEQITQTIERISMGKLDAEVPGELKDATDEIGRLARAFDRTIMSLKMSMRGQKERVEEKRSRGK